MINFYWLLALKVILKLNFFFALLVHHHKQNRRVVNDSINISFENLEMCVTQLSITSRVVVKIYQMVRNNHNKMIVNKDLKIQFCKTLTSLSKKRKIFFSLKLKFITLN